ncbi:hypothetical protein pb186bvf_005550 [Paramecium bursaria]
MNKESNYALGKLFCYQLYDAVYLKIGVELRLLNYQSYDLLIDVFLMGTNIDKI